MENQINETKFDKYYQSLGFWQTNKTIFKGIFIAILILLMLIPTIFVQNLVRERSNRKDEVIAEISSKWGSSQTIYGPMLVVPYFKSINLPNHTTKEIKSLIYYLPDELHIEGNIIPQARHRSIYDVTLYKTDIKIKGQYKSSLFSEIGIPKDKILWKEAYLQLGVTDIKGLEKQLNIVWDKKLKGDFDVMRFVSSSEERIGRDAKDTSTNSVETLTIPSNYSSLSYPVVLEPNNNHDFEISLLAKGSSGLYFTPTGNSTDVNIKSNWNTPSFDGNYLPNNSTHLVDQKGFVANWNIPKASRPYAQVNIDVMPKIENSSFGVKLLQPSDNYTKNERSVKYALLFISLTFAVFFLMELLQKKYIHPSQYILVGFALILFYVLLLSISEYAGFNYTYMIAGISIVILISGYISSILHKRKAGISFGLGLTGLYTYIFFLIQLEDYALLFGSVGLFVVLALIMYYTRKINWYETKTTQIV